MRAAYPEHNNMTVVDFEDFVVEQLCDKPQHGTTDRVVNKSKKERLLALAQTQARTLKRLLEKRVLTEGDVLDIICPWRNQVEIWPDRLPLAALKGPSNGKEESAAG